MNILLNYLWTGMILTSIACAAATGRMPQLSSAVLSGSENAVKLVFSMAGMMSVWTGLMKVADQSGITRLLSKALSPLMGRLFPDCEKGGAAVRAMCMNIAANLLGLGNAATPLGIAAMKELKKKNPTKTADNSMVTFVVLNSASIQLIPTYRATRRAESGAAAPFDILPAVWITSLAGLLCGLAAAKLWEGTHG